MGIKNEVQNSDLSYDLFQDPTLYYVVRVKADFTRLTYILL